MDVVYQDAADILQGKNFILEKGLLKPTGSHNLYIHIIAKVKKNTGH